MSRRVKSVPFDVTAQQRSINPQTGATVTMRSSSSLREPLTGISNIATNQKEYTWQEIQSIEARRRQLLRRSELPYWKILTYVEGTCLRALFSDWLLGMTMLVFFSVRLQVYLSGTLPDFAREVSRLSIDVIGGFLSFFLVLFVNQANARFQDMYKESMNACKRIYDVAGSVATALPMERARRLVRYMNAAHVAGYVGLSHAYSRRYFFETMKNEHGLLTETEMELIQHIDMDTDGPDACHALVEFCMKDIDSAYRENLIEVKDFTGLRDKLLAFRGSIDVLYEYSDQPIHFFYIHFLCLLSTLYLPLFAASNAFKAGEELHYTADFLSGLIVLLQSTFVIGLRMLGRKMVDPYGEDLEDLSVLHYVTSAWHRSQCILHTRFPETVDAALEKQLQEKHHSSKGRPVFAQKAGTFKSIQE
jgi:predicted membrane chloride channel (bestrophin family)